jgi:formate hydrogenlyase subunit 3/multisubunit Na+/H+ antiporter MnhD subunit
MRGRLRSTKGFGALSGATVVMALLQSVCTAVLTINSIRVGIGLAALAASTIAPLHRFHQDAIRIPMLTIAVIGAVVNLAVLGWIWHLRTRPESQWRRRQITPKQRRSERLQVAMAVLTLVLVGLEVWAHVVVHRKPHTAVRPAQPSLQHARRAVPA